MLVSSANVRTVQSGVLSLSLSSKTTSSPVRHLDGPVAVIDKFQGVDHQLALARDRAAMPGSALSFRGRGDRLAVGTVLLGDRERVEYP
jgi:hypothetical protein